MLKCEVEHVEIDSLMYWRESDEVHQEARELFKSLGDTDERKEKLSKLISIMYEQGFSACEYHS